MRAVGIDAVELERVAAAWERHGARFLDRVYTAAEQELAGRGEGPLQFYAGRFAAKEAVLKVLGTGWAKGLAFRDVEVLRDAWGKPEVRLGGAAAARAAELGFAPGSILVSITHTRRDAIAVAAC